jgi:aspartate-semialdehyde dehydrogenase
MGLKVAVVGATGNVGRELLALLAELKFPVSEIAAIASRRCMGWVIDLMCRLDVMARLN